MKELESLFLISLLCSDKTANGVQLNDFNLRAEAILVRLRTALSSLWQNSSGGVRFGGSQTIPMRNKSPRLSLASSISLRGISDGFDNSFFVLSLDDLRDNQAKSLVTNFPMLSVKLLPRFFLRLSDKLMGKFTFLFTFTFKQCCAELLFRCIII